MNTTYWLLGRFAALALYLRQLLSRNRALLDELGALRTAPRGKPAPEAPERLPDAELPVEVPSGPVHGRAGCTREPRTHAGAAVHRTRPRRLLRLDEALDILDGRIDVPRDVDDSLLDRVLAEREAQPPAEVVTCRGCGTQIILGPSAPLAERVGRRCPGCAARDVGRRRDEPAEKATADVPASRGANVAGGAAVLKVSPARKGRRPVWFKGRYAKNGDKGPNPGDDAA